jgi:hypothetical protein
MSGHESSDATYDCESEDSNNLCESGDGNGLVGGCGYNKITSHHDWESSCSDSAGERESEEDSADCSGSSSEYETDEGSFYNDESADLPGESSRHDQNKEPKRDITYQSIYMSSREPEGGGDCELSHESENDSVSDEEEDVRPGESSGPSPDCEPEGGSDDYGNLESGREPEGGGDCKLTHESEDDSVSDEEENVWPGESAKPSPDCEPEGGSVDYGNHIRGCEPEGGDDSELRSESGDRDASSEQAGVWEDPVSHDHTGCRDRAGAPLGVCTNSVGRAKSARVGGPRLPGHV